MNVRKPIDYSAMFEALDELMAANLPQMELYRGIGFSPRSLRRMRDFYHTYESAPEVMAEAMTSGWTQNILIMESDLTLQEKMWYIRAVRQFGWSKLELAEQIAASAHLEIALDLPKEVCYTEENINSVNPPGEAQAGGAWHRLHRENGEEAARTGVSFVFCSHDHLDHLQPETVVPMAKTQPKLKIVILYPGRKFHILSLGKRFLLTP